MKKQLRFGDLLRTGKFNKIRFSKKGEVIAINDNERIAMQISDYMKKQIFFPQCEEYEDHGDVGSFMQYLLLVLRCGKAAIKNANAVYAQDASAVGHNKQAGVCPDKTCMR